ncbi:MAG: YeiH family putative sulfate export transporter [Alphaproteobacteria bacterium]|nr:YeiH family putative sulfate export transporter [Alphaproteobacteria bacterium]
MSVSYGAVFRDPGTARGVLFVALFGALATALAMIPQMTAWHLHSLIIGMVLGMIFANTARHRVPESWNPGIHYTARNLLRIAIVLYGFRITFQTILNVGISGIVVSIAMVSLTFFLGLAFGTRVLKMDRDLSLLTAAGAAICGAAAVLATESVVRAAAWKSTVAVATVVLFGTLAMFLVPLLYRTGIIPLDLHDVGLYIGGSVHEVAHVVAAGNAISPETGDTAVIVKMIRVMMLAPFLLILGAILARIVDTQNGGKAPVAVPWFALLFIAMAGVHSLDIIPPGIVDGINHLDGFLLTMAMCALGMETRFSKFRDVGLKPLWLALFLFVWLLVGGFFITKAVLTVFPA